MLFIDESLSTYLFKSTVINYMRISVKMTFLMYISTHSTRKYTKLQIYYIRDI